jgi:hypothetical protein
VRTEPTERLSLSVLKRDRWLIPLALAALLSIASFLPLSIEKPKSDAWKLHEIGLEIGKWHRSRVREVDYQHLGSVDFRDKVYRDYERGDERVTLFVGSDDRTRRDKSLLSPKTLTEGSGWQIEEHTRILPSSFGRPADRIIASRGKEQVLSLHLRLGTRGSLEESFRWFLALDLWPGNSPTEIGIVRVTAPIVHGDRVRAERLAEEFLRDLEPILRHAAPTSIGFENEVRGAS